MSKIIIITDDGKSKKYNKKSKKKSKKEIVNKVMNKTLDVMEGIAKFGQQIDKMTDGTPKLSKFQQGDIMGLPPQVKKRRYTKRKKNKRVKYKKKKAIAQDIDSPIKEEGWDFSKIGRRMMKDE